MGRAPLEQLRRRSVSRLNDGTSMKRVLVGIAAAVLLNGAVDARNRLDGDFVSRDGEGLSLSVRAMGEAYAVRLESEKCGESLEGFAKADSAISRSLQFEKKIDGSAGACYVQLGYDPKNDSYAIDAANCDGHVSKACEFDGLVQRLVQKSRRQAQRPRARAREMIPVSPPPSSGWEALHQAPPERPSLFGHWPF